MTLSTGCYFNPRSRKGSDTVLLSGSRRICSFQSTLPQGERLDGKEVKGDCGDHFNPRSRKGSDFNQSKGVKEYGNFNPRSRKGSDDPVITTGTGYGNISIHAPARGATHNRFHPRPCTYDFNPRSRKGSDGSRKKLE